MKSCGLRLICDGGEKVLVVLLVRMKLCLGGGGIVYNDSAGLVPGYSDGGARRSTGRRPGALGYWDAAILKRRRAQQ